ncbi:MAG: hybrid sensor histidine kinase/response regulator [Bacteroidetes Order II. Incertae sedis bacterium]|jgi:two-component system, sensor histidine kinase and response regulator|nr:hybrid sensor histidine kinase/response regulator [Bacteroidetes Order II. bacterium]MBT4052682.1 hybrid sensor histidine kinase/response regulator [Bacteroidetes Order II. bacterium]MBT4603312.1 hybrid sensor histidine kinase/response regulator [Bacteroidetes Order II. bacterium]MBT5250090.1 hybrid sensor histidine kinase/response regulator [Bacteroidetes Order II. bacterium]MBT6201817.1 hybrid sensor histidine kinase/response regulator [Bacteroidetes Order II. bacterium]
MDNRSKRILIVDDTPENIQVLGAQLRKQEYMINVAQNGQQALDVAAKTKPDLILLDVMMPVMDGFTACKRLKENPETADIPVIFLTARIESQDVVKGLDLGGVDYVTKPFNAAELLQRVSTHLKIRDLQTSLEDRVNELDAAAKIISRMARENESFLRHELNNAISPVLGYADMLLKNPDLAVEKRIKWTQKIKSNAQGMGDLLNALRDLQALERGSHTLSKKPCDVEHLVMEEISNLEIQYGNGLKINFDSSCDSAEIHADPGFFPGVFRNLLKNAVEHVHVLPQTDQGLGVVMSDSEDTITVTIKNGGSPIPADLIPTFFEKFNSTKVSGGGTGLGTSYAHVVVTAHDGTIDVTSSTEHGTAVTVEMPKHS